MPQPSSLTFNLRDCSFSDGKLLSWSIGKRPNLYFAHSTSPLSQHHKQALLGESGWVKLDAPKPLRPAYLRVYKTTTTVSQLVTAVNKHFNTPLSKHAKLALGIPGKRKVTLRSLKGDHVHVEGFTVSRRQAGQITVKVFKAEWGS